MTSAPALYGMRRSCPEKGAETTYRCLMRVLPSSLTVTRKVPTVTSAVSTGTGFSQKPPINNASNKAAPKYGSQRRERRLPLPPRAGLDAGLSDVLIYPRPVTLTMETPCIQENPHFNLTRQRQHEKQFGVRPQ